MIDEYPITIKEVFEKVIKLDIKVEMQTGENRKTRRIFQVYVFLMVGLLITNILLTLLMMI